MVVCTWMSFSFCQVSLLITVMEELPMMATYERLFLLSIAMPRGMADTLICFSSFAFEGNEGSSSSTLMLLECQLLTSRYLSSEVVAITLGVEPVLYKGTVNESFLLTVTFL
ncbi:MAG: hypothetical protein K0Q66_1898 [Chitinophagaceae bacterium]|nr:hypothetical protein [Chitinophagaceae bacterium]